jgi:hypothetical protein
MRIQIAEFKIVGNRWERDGIRSLADRVVPDSEKTLDPRFALGVISNKTDPGVYIPPGQVKIENDIPEKEQSILVRYDDIEPGMGWRIFKRFPGTGLDLSTTYRDLGFLVRTDKLDPDLEYFVRLGFDSLTFYEVSFPLAPEYFGVNNWAACTVALNDLTDLKTQGADSVVTGTATDLRDPNRVYTARVVGKPSRPSLFNVRFIYAGFRNKSSQPVSGEMWINDIFLGNRRQDADFAQRLTASVNMGNIITLSGSWQRTGSEYVAFGQRRGSGTESRAVSLSGKTNLEHFIPLFGFNVPIGGTFSRNTSLPKFMPNSDTEFTAAALRDSMKSESSARGFSASLTRTNSKNTLLKYTFDKLKANYSISQSRQLNPSSSDTTLTMSGTFDYAISFAGRHRVRLFKDFGIRYWPNSINYRLSASRTEGRRYRSVGGRFIADPSLWNAALSNFGSLTWAPMPSLTTSFNMQTQRDLKLPHEWFGVDIGTEVDRSHTLQAAYRPPPVWLVRSFSPDFSYNVGYREDSSPNARKEGDPSGTRNVSANRGISTKVSYDLGRNLGKLFDKIGLSPADGRAADPRARSAGGQAGASSGGEGAGGAAPGGQEGAAPADSTEAKPKGRIDPVGAARGVAEVLTSIRKINASIQKGNQTSYNRIPDRPSIAYQLGLTPGSGVSYGGQVFDEPEREQGDLKILMDSGLQLTRNIDVAGRFSRSTGATTFRGATTEVRSSTWPDLSLSWKGLEAFGPFRGIFTNASATITYNRTSQENSRAGAVETKREAQNLTPSVVFQWKNDIRSSVGVQYGKDMTDTRGAVNENSNLNVNMDVKYTFTPGKPIKIPLPFLRSKTLKSRLDTSLSGGYTRSGGRRSTGEPGRFVSLPGTSSIRVSPRVAYNFSSALNGSFFVDYSRSYSDATDQTVTVVPRGAHRDVHLLGARGPCGRSPPLSRSSRDAARTRSSRSSPARRRGATSSRSATSARARRAAPPTTARSVSS